MPLYTDQCGRSVSIPNAPQRIISLVPSQTELLYDLGLGDRVVGITKFCIHPSEWFHSKTRIGGTKTIKMDIVHQLQPDLIIANKEENVKEQVEDLALQFPIWVSDVNNLEDALGMITMIGTITSTIAKAKEIERSIRIKFESLTPNSRLQTPDSTCYLIWKDPYITVGGDTFINNMLQYAGFTSTFAHLSRYPEITTPQLQTLNPRHIFLSSEPYPFKEKHIEELQRLLPQTKIVLVDGELFSWYGSRLLKAPDYFLALKKEIAFCKE